MSEQRDRFHWKDGDVVILENSSPDPKKMSETEKAFFLKQQEKSKD